MAYQDEGPLAGGASRVFMRRSPDRSLIVSACVLRSCTQASRQCCAD
jgi:hypothetical protein